jgi:two-component system cell cycle sensor histidine kinase/response regulator CckA
MAAAYFRPPSSLCMAENIGRPISPSPPNDLPEYPTVEEKLNQSEAGFRLLFMNNPQPMWVFDVQTNRFLEVNSAAVEHYGYSRDEFLRMRITDIRPQEDVPRLLKDAAKARGGLRHAGVWRHLRKNGEVIDVEIASDHLTFAGQEAVLVVARDITQQKKAEEALRQAEQKYRSMVEDAIVGIFQSSPEGRYLSVNPAMARMLGYDSPDELIASITDIGRQVYVDPRRRKEFGNLLEKQGVVRNFECQVYRKDGSQMWFSANARAILKDGVVVSYEGMNEDITERKLLEGQLLQAQKMEAVGLLAGGVAHDFNNTLGVITGYGDLLQESLPEDDPARRYAEEIRKAAHRAATLTRQLLAFSRKQVIQPVVLDLNSVILDMDKMLRRLIGENIEIMIARDPSPARVKADPGQIEQILMNLAVNARDAMPQGGKIFINTADVQVDESYVRRHRYFKPGRYVTLTFSDTGHGMDQETRARIFEPFFTTKEIGKGTGLGLSTVYGIVKQNEGYIRVYSEPGKGCTFKIFLPQVEENIQIPIAAPLPDTPARATGTILVVEDEPALRTLVRNCLESHGYTVLEAGDGNAAMLAADQHPSPIHLLLTDVIMPGMSGHELANQLLARRPEVKVVYMSGYAGDLIAQYGVLDPATVLLEKPFSLQALLSKVHQALQASEKGKAASST